MDLDISHRSQSRSRDGGGWRTNEKQNIFKKKNKKRIKMKKIKIIKKENKKMKKKENKKERKQEVNN